ncbi:hypothetical protein [Secundilactobacillus kimchicus]|uniref:Uncharacterized protein n=1 Tax=Secundilactobacillus kimchicus JCM 15530 TaxID=1302272 RepID=A0A0R1HRB1_9LACO|nr:hypothetical protein [Secundilactobacillus kimchicus]KRK49016.1 hypothetical protein FC96_GL001342 [Secundilactobacillus kimchicus JCM 15530]MBT9671783.1 hypothetical protein [Secundilactobacillus kimchicus]
MKAFDGTFSTQAGLASRISFLSGKLEIKDCDVGRVVDLAAEFGRKQMFLQYVEKYDPFNNAEIWSVRKELNSIVDQLNGLLGNE